MVSMLDCIKRVPSILETILNHREETFAPLWTTFGTRMDEVDEIVLVGSGTSNTSSITARYLAERLSGIRVSVTVPNEFLYSLSACNPKALYLFLSQTGTPILTRQALHLALQQGFLTAALSEAATTPIAREAGVFLNMHCGKEEYPMRTIGYSASVLGVAMLAVEIGRRRDTLSAAGVEDAVAQARAAAAGIPAVIDATMAWLDANRRNMLRSESIIFYGSGSLYGVALEGAVKVWETPQITTMGFELEEGLHGPNYGYTQRHCVIVLNDGGVDDAKARAMASYMRVEKNNGFLVGAHADAPSDLAFDPKGGMFACLEFAAVVQTLAFRLAVDQGRDLYAPHDNSAMEKYFRSHSADDK